MEEPLVVVCSSPSMQSPQCWGLLGQSFTGIHGNWWQAQAILCMQGKVGSVFSVRESMKNRDVFFFVEEKESNVVLKGGWSFKQEKT